MTTPTLHAAMTPPCGRLAAVGLTMLALFVGETQAQTDLRVVACLREDRFAGSSGHALAFSPDGKLLANARNRIGIWDVATGKRLIELDGHYSDNVFYRVGVTGLAFSSDGQTLISTGGDGAIRVWNVTTGKMRREILVPWWWVGEEEWGLGRVPLHGMSVTPDSKRLAVTAHGGSIHMWNLETGEHEWAFGKNLAEKLEPAKFGPIDGINVTEVWKLPLNANISHPTPLISPDGSALAAVTNDGVQVWGLADRAAKFKTDSGGDAAYSPDGRSLVTALYEGVTVWDAQTGEKTGGFTDDVPIFTPLRFSPDGRLMTGSDTANGIRIWDFPAGRLLKSLTYGGSSFRNMAVSPDGNFLAAAVGRSRLHLWDLRTDRLQYDGGHSGPIRVLRFSPDGRFLISGANDASLRLWNTERWTQQHSLVQPEMFVSALEFLPGGDRILVGDVMGKSRRISFPGLEVEDSFEHEEGVSGYVLRDARLFVALMKNPGTFETWDLEMPRRIASRKQHSTYGMRVASAREQNLAASGDYDGNVVVWRDDPAIAVARFHVDGGTVEAIAFSPDGKQLATICWNNSELGTILEIRDSLAWGVQTRLKVSGSGVTSIDWSPDGTTLAIAAMGRPSNIYFVRQNRIESVEVPEEFESLCFSPDGKLLAGGDEFGAIRIWSVANHK